MKKTPWGRMDMHTNEFYFFPKFSLNFLPHAEDGMFIENDLEVSFKFDPYKKKWTLRGIWDHDGRVHVNEETLKGITTQGLFRINCAIDYIFDSGEKDNV
tara:strand:- start:7128 stop:7427 length:300 start_codon:yes stop_codon:yes gene_type:complete